MAISEHFDLNIFEELIDRLILSFNNNYNISNQDIAKLIKFLNYDEYLLIFYRNMNINFNNYRNIIIISKFPSIIYKNEGE